LYRHGVVIEALSAMPSDVVVLMSRFRAQPDELTKIERQAEALGLSDRVVMVPEIEHAEMPAFYRLADVVVSVPVSDSTAVTNLEALACGRPIVAADLPSVREWLGELDNAILVPVDDVEATAAALRQVLDQRPEIKAERGLRARSIVVERADQARSLARVESLYLDLVRRRARKGGEVR
jgi:glycosyltransferase involved in cell wall biosynthesis